jgi:hypothetical protein
LQEHQLEEAVIEPANVTSKFLAQIRNVRGEMRNRRSKLGNLLAQPKDQLEWHFPRLLHAPSVLRRLLPR